MTHFINEFLVDYPLLILNADDINGKKAFKKDNPSGSNRRYCGTAYCAATREDERAWVKA